MGGSFHLCQVTKHEPPRHSNQGTHLANSPCRFPEWSHNPRSSEGHPPNSQRRVVRWGEVILGDMLCCDVVRSNITWWDVALKTTYTKLHWDVILHSLQSYSFKCSCRLRTLSTHSTMDAPMTGSMVHGSSSSSSMATDRSHEMHMCRIRCLLWIQEFLQAHRFPEVTTRDIFF